MDIYKDKGLTGLANLGNTCYLNSVTHILSNTHELSIFLDNISLINKNIDSIILNEYNDLRKIIWNKNVIVAPKKYVVMIFNVNKQKNLQDFTDFGQNDFMEFYDLLLNNFHNSLKNIKEYNYDYKKDFYIKNKSKYNNFVSNIFKNDYSIINNLFSGFFEIKIKSVKSNKVLSISYDLFNSLSLGFKQNSSVNELIKDFLKMNY